MFILLKTISFYDFEDDFFLRQLTFESYVLFLMIYLLNNSISFVLLMTIIIILITLIKIINYERTLQFINFINVTFNVFYNIIFLIFVRSTVILFERRRISRIQIKENNDRFEKCSLTFFLKRSI